MPWRHCASTELYWRPCRGLVQKGCSVNKGWQTTNHWMTADWQWCMHDHGLLHECHFCWHLVKATSSRVLQEQQVWANNALWTWQCVQVSCKRIRVLILALCKWIFQKIEHLVRVVFKPSDCSKSWKQLWSKLFHSKHFRPILVSDSLSGVQCINERRDATGAWILHLQKTSCESQNCHGKISFHQKRHVSSDAVHIIWEIIKSCVTTLSDIIMCLGCIRAMLCEKRSSDSLLCQSSFNKTKPMFWLTETKTERLLLIALAACGWDVNAEWKISEVQRLNDKSRPSVLQWLKAVASAVIAGAPAVSLMMMATTVLLVALLAKPAAAAVTDAALMTAILQPISKLFPAGKNKICCVCQIKCASIFWQTQSGTCQWHSLHTQCKQMHIWSECIHWVSVKWDVEPTDRTQLQKRKWHLVATENIAFATP